MFRSLTVIGLFFMSTTLIAETIQTGPVCPESQLTAAPSAASLGPYQIEGWGSPNARAFGLPNCQAVAEIIITIERGAGSALVAEVTLDEQSGMYEVTTTPRD